MPATFLPLAVSAYTATSALGHGLDAHLQSLRDQRSGLRRNDFGTSTLDCWIGRVDGIEQTALPTALAEWECRNNRLAWLGLQQDGLIEQVQAVRQRYGAGRIAVLMGTSTASIGATEEGYQRRTPEAPWPPDLQRPVIHNPHSLGAFVAAALELSGPCMTISTACSSSAKVFAAAERLLRLGLIDAALVGGVDSLCGSVLFGFNSLELVSPQPCRPFDAQRDGISIGEAAAFALLERASDAPHARVQVLGCGESSDAHHMSTPDPGGIGAKLALAQMFEQSGLSAADIGYINLHGTASQKNDAMEASVVAAMFPTSTRVSSTKALTGHTLGAAGAVEAAIAMLALEHGLVPGNAGVQSPDPLCSAHFAWRNEARGIDVALSHSFGFGGSNACLALARADRAVRA